jgi:hemerythrin
MDNEHKELFNRISTLFTASVNKNRKDEIPGLIKNLKDYVIVHFKDEEDFMNRIQYPERERHFKIHQQFLTEVGSMLTIALEEGINASLLIEMQQKIVRWLVEHIGVVDMGYAEFAVRNHLEFS